MIDVLKAFLKEHKGHICMYIGFIGIFYVVFDLYDIPTEAVRYATLLSFVWLLAYAAVSFAKCVKKHRMLLDAEQRTDAGLEDIPEAQSIAEEDYQRIVKNLYHEKQELEAEVRIAKREMADYYGMWVHQIKTPIAALGLLLQVQERLLAECGQEEQPKNGRDRTKEEQPEKGRDSAGQAEIVKGMKLELFKIEQYVEMVLTYLRMGDMSADFSFKDCDLDDMIRQAVKKYSQMFISKKIKLCYEPVNRTVLTDEKWLVFVIEQLLSNALKYTKEGSISIYMEGERLVIRDTGIGISKEDLPRIFEKGFTGYNGRRDKKSTGIGLYLCKTIMDKLGHGLVLESAEGEGTKALLYLEKRKDIRM